MKKSLFKNFVLAVVIVFGVMHTPALIAFGQDEVQIDLPGKTIKLYPPFEIVQTMMYKDGGTVGIVVEDSRGVSVPFCLDGRIKVPADSRHLYIGATHPGNSKAEEVPIGGKAEKTVLKILKSAEIKSSSPYLRKDLVTNMTGKLQSR